MRKLVFMYSGQGSQYYQMGRKLFEESYVYRKALQRFEQIGQEFAGYSVITELFQDSKKKTDTFNELKYTHPAVYMTQCALTKCLLEQEIFPDYYMGSSLGEIVALAMTTGSCDELFLQVLEQCNIFEQCDKGGMTAIFADVDKFEHTPELYENSYLASRNFKNMYVISGTESGLESAEKYLKEKREIYQRLPVEYAFHSRLIEPIKADLLSQENLFKLKEFSVPIISCCKKERFQYSYDNGYVWKIVREQIDFQGALHDIKNRNEEFLFVDLSFTGSQANYIRRIVSNDHIKVYAPFSMFHDSEDIDTIITTIQSMRKGD